MYHSDERILKKRVEITKQLNPNRVFVMFMRTSRINIL